MSVRSASISLCVNPENMSMGWSTLRSKSRGSAFRFLYRMSVHQPPPLPGLFIARKNGNTKAAAWPVTTAGELPEYAKSAERRSSFVYQDKVDQLTVFIC